MMNINDLVQFLNILEVSKQACKKHVITSATPTTRKQNIKRSKLSNPSYGTIIVWRIANILKEQYPEEFKECVAIILNNFIYIHPETNLSAANIPLDIKYVDQNSMLSKYPGKTSNYSKFLKNRKRLERHFLLAHPFVRKIFNSCVNLPSKCFEIPARNKVQNYQDIKKHFTLEIEYMRKSLHTWHKNIVEYSNNFKINDTKIINKLHHIGNGLISVYLSESMRNIIEDLIDLTSSPDKISYITITLFFDSKFYMVPSLQDMCDDYDLFIKEILLIGEDLRDINGNRMHFYIPMDLVNSYNDQIKKNFVVIYLPITDHVESLNSHYKDTVREICSLIQEEEINNEKDISIDKGFELYKKYTCVYGNVTKLLNVEPFSVAELHQVPCKNSFKVKITQVLNIIKSKMIVQHQWENEDICKIINLVQLKTFTDPETADELVELGEYINWVKNSSFVINLEERVNSSTKVMIKLLEITELADEHVEFITKAINLYSNLGNMLEENTSKYEQHKYQFEEQLQRNTEILIDKINANWPKFDIFSDMNNINCVRSYLPFLTRMIKEYNELKDQVEVINKEEALYKFPSTSFPELTKQKEHLFTFFLLIRLCIKWHRRYFVWMDGTFTELKFTIIRDEVDKFLLEFQKVEKNYRDNMHKEATDNLPKRFTGFMDDPDPLNHPAPLRLCAMAIWQIRDFQKCFKTLEILANDTLLPRHWKEISDMVGLDISPNSSTSLRKIIEVDMMDKIEKLELIRTSAEKEGHILEGLVNMQAEWKQLEFRTSQCTEMGVDILVGLEEIQIVLDDHIGKSLAMISSVFVKPYANEVKEWYNKIATIKQILDQWKQVQRRWLYISPLLSCRQIAKDIGAEASILFNKVNETVKTCLIFIQKQPKVIQILSSDNIFDKLMETAHILENLNFIVERYLEQKKESFPRFYFLAQHELIAILSENKYPKLFSINLSKMFQGVCSLDYTENTIISSITNSQAETLPISNIDISNFDGANELLLKEIQRKISYSLRKLLTDNYRTTYRNVWLQKLPQQIILTLENLICTYNIEENLIAKNSLQTLFNQKQTEIQELQELIQQSPNSKKVTLNLVLLQDLYLSNVIDNLIKFKVDSCNDFYWLVQLKYKIENDCYLQILHQRMKYSYEYVGSQDVFVITPATEKVYYNLITSFNAHCNIVLEGKTAVGKSATFKSLALAAAKFYIRFNSFSHVNYKILNNFFKGMLLSGSWFYCDLLNQLNAELISLLTQFLREVATSKQTKTLAILIDGISTTLNPECFLCITSRINKFERGNLAENFKARFRTIVVLMPDYAVIAEVYLRACGFRKFRAVASKLLVFFRLSAQQFSIQNHYNFSLKQIKACLLLCAKQKSKHPIKDEQILLYEIIMEMFRPRVQNIDNSIFERILTDLFPQVEKPIPDNYLFVETVKRCCSVRNLQATEYFYESLLGMWQLVKTQLGIVVLGEGFSGKSSMIQMLADVSNNLEENVQFKYIYPKAVTFQQLHGYQNDSLGWVDGIFTKILRQFSSIDSNGRKWIICDGPMDDTEILYSLLGNERRICLNSGEILHLPENISLIFETTDLSYASPTIVSSLGIMYIRAPLSCWKYLTKSWISNNINKKWLDGNEDFISSLLDWIIPKSFEILNSCGTPLIIQTQSQLVKNFIIFIQIYMDKAYEENKNKEDNDRNVLYWIQAVFLFAGLWAFGGTLNLDGRNKFDTLYKKLWKNEECEDRNNVLKVETILPQNDSWYNYSYLFKGRGKWIFLPEYLRDKKIEITQEHLIPCVEQFICFQLVEFHISNYYPILLIGPTGAGKTFYMNNLLMKTFNRDKYIPKSISLTRTVSANQLQDFILTKLSKKQGGMYEPSKGKREIVFIDNLNVPEENSKGVKPPLELLRQILDCGNWFDLENASPIYLRNIIFVGATRGLKNKQEIYSRLLRHFSVYALNDFTENSVRQIYNTILLFELKRNGFPNDISSTVQQIVSATLQIYTFVRSKFKPTVIKPHYRFNLRDFSRVIYGCAKFRKESADKKVFAKLWIHESLRIFSDRLINSCDQSLLYETINFAAKASFEEAVIFENTEDFAIDSENLIFTTHLNKVDRRYEETTVKSLYEITISRLEKYNCTHKIKLDLILFDSALRHLSRISRILSTPYGNCLLIGISGSGRQSLSKLAAFALDFTLKQPGSEFIYETKEWRKDLKEILKLAGICNQDTVLLLTQSYLNETFMEDIDLILSQGELIRFFQVEERQQILESVRESITDSYTTLEINTTKLFNIFKQRCQRKLHIILSISQVQTNFCRTLNLYPSLINNCVIDWFHDWPKDVAIDIAKFVLKDINLEETIRENVIENCTYIQDSLQKFTKYQNFYVTPLSYLNFLHLYRKLMQKQTEEFLQKERRLLAGLNKLALAKDRIAEMENSLEEFKPQLKEFTQNAIKMSRKIAEENAEVEKASALVRSDEKIANAQAAEAQNLKTECETELAQAIPILEDAISALNTLKPTDITLVKSMKNPPDAIKLVMAAVCVMKGVKPDRIPDPSTGKRTVDFWGPSKRILSDMTFLQQLKEYDKDDIKPEIIAKIRTEFISNKDFKPHIVSNASSAAEGLCKWVIAMDKYDAVAKEVAPKREKLEAAELKYAATAKILKEKKEQLASLEKSLANLNVTFARATLKQRFLQNSIDLCESKLYRAEKLIATLANEKDKWLKLLENLQTQRDNLKGDMLISAGVIDYLGMFTFPDRYKIMNKWHTHIRKSNIPSSLQYDFTTFFTLSANCKYSDNFISQNQLIICNSIRYCLLLDPQLEGSIWIQNTERLNNILIINYYDKDLLNRLEYCIQNGVPLLIEDVKSLDNSKALNSILYKQIYINDGSSYIDIGSNSIIYNDNFKLYLTNQEIQPLFTAETLNKVTVVNFQVNVNTLHSRTLKTLTKIEDPELYRDWKNSYAKYCNESNEIISNSENIIRELAETEDILDNQSVIDRICNYSETVISVKTKLEITLTEYQEFEKCKEKYKLLAEYCSKLYYCTSLLSKIDPMYRYSSIWFIKLLKFSIDNAQRSQDVITRLSLLKHHFTLSLHKHITKSLHKEHRLVFSFLLYLTIFDIATSDELDFLLTSSRELIEKNEMLGWLDSRVWTEIVHLSKVEGFLGLAESVVNESLMWKGVYDLFDVNDLRLPDIWEDKLSDFQKLLIIKAFRMRDLHKSVEKMLRNELGKEYVLSPSFDLEESYAQSSKTTPLLFLLSENSDPNPSSTIVEFTKINRLGVTLRIISLGHDNDEWKELIEKACESGCWICLENCHLALSCLRTLQEIYVNLGSPSTHPNFRLWLTTRSDPSFPANIVQNSIKMTKEQPVGIRESMLNAYSIHPIKNPKFFRGCIGKELMFTKLLYCLAFFHTKIRCRAKFTPVGWRIPYGFSDIDFSIATEELQSIINNYEDPIEPIGYSIKECNYGGKIVNQWDYRLLQCIFQNSINRILLTSPNYHIFNEEDCYQVPKQANYLQHMNHIKTFPTHSSVELLGLHDSIFLKHSAIEAENFLTVFKTAFGTNDTSDFEKDISKVVAIVESLLFMLPTESELEIKFSNCTVQVLHNEVRQYCILLKTIRCSLTNLLESSRDFGIFTSQLNVVGKSLMLNTIPLSWLKYSYPSLKSLSAYINDFLERIDFIYRWVQEGPPKQFWLSAFFSSQAFLTDIKLHAARKFGVDYPMITLDYQNGEGIDVYGLFIDGARWNNATNNLTELLPKQRFDKLPLLRISPILIENLVIGRRYTCPLYKTLLRDGEITNMGLSEFILPVLLDTDIDENKCIERGVALVGELIE